ncbi:putative tRNA synthetase class II [Cryptosporidium canis]|nr:putative tRNA synthetase class II [Cryptosporidium canis]
MKVGRKKQVKRIIKYYKINYGFEEPYRLLIDGTFIMAALKNKIHIKEQLPKILGGKATPIVTDCIFKEIEMLCGAEGKMADFSGAKLIARGYFRHRCGHTYCGEESSGSGLRISLSTNSLDVSSDHEGDSEKEVPSEGPAEASSKATRTFDSFRCILDVVSKNNNSKKFMVASQDPLLRRKLQKIPGVPLIYLYNQVPILEQPSAASCSQQSISEESRMGPQQWEHSLIPSLKEGPDGADLSKDSKIVGQPVAVALGDLAGERDSVYIHICKHTHVHLGAQQLQEIHRIFIFGYSGQDVQKGSGDCQSGKPGHCYTGCAFGGVMLVQNWTMFDGVLLSWELTPSQLYITLNCSSRSKQFIGFCVNGIKEIHGGLSNVVQAICSPPARYGFLEKSCDDAVALTGSLNLVFLALLASASAVILGVVFLMLYSRSFKVDTARPESASSEIILKSRPRIGLAVVSIVFNILALLGVCLSTVLIIYLSQSLRDILSFTSDTPVFTIEPSTGSLGWGFYLLLLANSLLVVHILALVDSTRMAKRLWRLSQEGTREVLHSQLLSVLHGGWGSLAQRGLHLYAESWGSRRQSPGSRLEGGSVPHSVRSSDPQLGPNANSLSNPLVRSASISEDQQCSRNQIRLGILPDGPTSASQSVQLRDGAVPGGPRSSQVPREPRLWPPSSSSSPPPPPP